MEYTVRDLDVSTWDAFAELVERNNGIFGGCWCTAFHPEGRDKGIDRRAVKEERVRCGSAHAALVFDENGVAQGWCQWGGPEELPEHQAASACTCRSRHPSPTGGSPASTSTRNIAAGAWPGRRSAARWSRSPEPVAVSWRRYPR